jgi:hypothetical protein
MVLLLFKTYSVSETRFCLRLQVKPIQLGPISLSPDLDRTGNRDQ